MGYGVIGSPADSGSVSLGSSPGTPAQYSSKEVQVNMDRVYFNPLADLKLTSLRPRRLAAQDSGFSSQLRGFESLRGYITYG